MNLILGSGNLPETDLSGLRWRDVHDWVRLIPTSRVRDATKRKLERMRQQHAATVD